jgi:hypothetical protein
MLAGAKVGATIDPKLRFPFVFIGTLGGVLFVRDVEAASSNLVTPTLHKEPVRLRRTGSLCNVQRVDRRKKRAGTVKTLGLPRRYAA